MANNLRLAVGNNLGCNICNIYSCNRRYCVLRDERMEKQEQFKAKVNFKSAVAKYAYCRLRFQAI